jgi:hypothetical protein
MEQHGGQFWRIDTMVAELNQPDRPISAASEVGGKIAQHSVRVLILVIDQRRQIALRIKHDEPSLFANYFQSSKRSRREAAAIARQGNYNMIPKSGYRFSEQIMLKQ